MSDILDRCLQDLETRLDDGEEQRNFEAWQGFINGKCREEFFVPPQRTPSPPRVEWPEVNVNAAIADYDLMLLSQFRTCSDILASGGSGRLAVRCNYGTGILPSLFGCAIFMMDDATNTLPSAVPLGSRGRIRQLIREGVPGIRGGLGEKVFAAAERFLQAFARHPGIARWVSLYHPDAQGPIDIAEVVWGSDIFYAFYDDRQLLRDLLGLATETYGAFMRAWYELVPQKHDWSDHWNLMHKGVLMIRNDSLMNLSPEVYADLIRPHDQKLFDEFGGGAVHFCGRGCHFIEAMSQVRGLSAINMSQPELNDMEMIYRNTVDRGIKLVGFPRAAAESAGRPLRGQVQV
jgi:hypothetical protein